ncbi:MAG: sterol desaturase family protein [Spirochaetota bacterium]
MPWQQTAPLVLLGVTLAVTLEWLLSLLVRRHVYSFTGALTNIADYTVYLVIAAVYGYVEYLLFTYLQLSFQTAALPASGLYWLLLFLADDFCFYWFHRMSHRLGILWLSHVVHHSSNEFNLAVGLRQTWLPFLGMMFWLPLAFAGFRPEHILLMQAVSLTYQFLMHTQLISMPRIYGWVFNTPSHHQVHHGRNAEYIDKNFGGVLIVWDRLFRSFAPERAAVDFGIDQIPERGEVIFAQLWGPWQYLRSWFSTGGANPVKANYAAQKTSPVWSALLLALALGIFFMVIKNPRWFI